MKKSLKIWMMAIAGVILLGTTTTALADNDKPVSVSSLPVAARQIINNNFKGKKVALAKMESSLASKSYDVVFSNGDKVEFDRKGQWTELDCRHSGVPSALVPSAIKSYVNRNYTGQRIVKLERDRNGYEAKLASGLEITFNKKFQVTDIDN